MLEEKQKMSQEAKQIADNARKEGEEQGKEEGREEGKEEVTYQTWMPWLGSDKIFLQIIKYM